MYGKQNKLLVHGAIPTHSELSKILWFPTEYQVAGNWQDWHSISKYSQFKLK
jgi:hypothetical protein